MTLKNRLKRVVQSFPVLWNVYTRIKGEVIRVVKLRYFAYDIFHTYCSMNWVSSKPSGAREILSAQLLFQYHKLEKGLVMLGEKRLFGLIPARETLTLLNDWEHAEHRCDDPVYIGAVETLRCYRERLNEYNLDQSNKITSDLDGFFARHCDQNLEYSTPQKLPTIQNESATASYSFRQLMEARRSVRDFLPDRVPIQIFHESIRVAQLSPSACNRQPWKIIIISDDTLKRKLLSHQNGNKGFGHLAPHIAVIISDESCFFDASERHEPYIDGGLFAMSFLLALRSNDVSSCCLNWCVNPSSDRAAHNLLGLKDALRIVMLIAIGYAPDECSVPQSPRRALEEVLTCL